jgi:hypothetical protein
MNFHLQLNKDKQNKIHAVTKKLLQPYFYNGNLSSSSIDNLILTYAFSAKRKSTSSKPPFHY